MPNIEEKKTLVFTYDRPFHMSQKHSKLSMNQTEPFVKIYQQEIAYFKLWFMTEPSEVQPISHQHSAMLIMLK